MPALADFVDHFDASGTHSISIRRIGAEMDYGAGVFAGTDFSRLRFRLVRISGCFMLSVNDFRQTRAVSSNCNRDAGKTLDGVWEMD
jgi:hypothetical protein